MEEKKFKVLDSRKQGGATQITIEVSDSEGRGNAIVDFWGPNKRKECTVLVKKTKEHEERFVKIVAKEIVQPLIDSCISGRGIESTFMDSLSKASSFKKQCEVCEKTFTSQKYLKIHVTKIHTKTKNKCDFCEFLNNNKMLLRSHMRSSKKIEKKEMELSFNEKDKNLDNLEKVSWEESQIDEQTMDAEECDTPKAQKEDENQTLERSKFRDEQIQKKEIIR